MCFLETPCLKLEAITMVNKVYFRRHIILAVLTFIGAVTLGLFVGDTPALAAGDQSTHPAALSRTMSLTGNTINTDSPTTLYTRTSQDSYYGNNSQNAEVLYPLDLDKYKNLTIKYSVKNISSQTQKVLVALRLPATTQNSDGTQTDNTYLMPYDSSRSSEVSLTSTQHTPAFTAAYATTTDRIYEPGVDLNTNANIVGFSMGGNLLSSFQELNPSQSVTISVPVKLMNNYDFTKPLASWFYDSTHMYDADDATKLDIELPNQFLDFIPYKSIILEHNDTIAANNYAELKKAASQNATLFMVTKKFVEQDTTTNKDSVVNITPTSTPGNFDITYTYNGVTKKITGTTTDKSMIDAKDFTVNYGSIWDSEKFNGLTAHTDSNGTAVSPLSKDVTVSTQLNGKEVTVNTSNAGAVYDLTYSLANGVSKNVHVTVGQNSNNGGSGGNGANTNTTVPDTTTTVPNNNTNSSSSSTSNPVSSSSNDTVNVPSYTVVKGAAVYAVKPVYMYRHANFKKSQRVAKYPKAKRVNRPMFIVTGYARSTNGALRYKVRDVNNGKKTAGKVGYITANRKYVVNVYYKTLPKSKKITVISNKGVHAYKRASLTGKVKTYKKGTRLTVKKMVKHNLTTRYQLSNGYYVTANKKLVIQGNH